MSLQSCESCGREFRCGADTGACWCDRIALGPDRVAILREHFERCLCPDCLKVAAGKGEVRLTHPRKLG
jgi:hypothetical protein